jgi:hypothetical protein
MTEVKLRLVTWCRITEDIILYPYYIQIEGFVNSKPFEIKKGTYVQIDKEEPSLYLDNEGDGFLYFPLEVLEEVTVETTEEYKGNPSDWWTAEKIYQG